MLYIKETGSFWKKIIKTPQTCELPNVMISYERHAEKHRKQKESKKTFFQK